MNDGTRAQTLCRVLPPIVSYRLATRVFLRTRPAAGETFITRTATGALFSFESGEVIADQVRMCGYWDWRAQTIAETFCTKGATIVEAGANTGTETIGFAQVVGETGRVIAFEPLPDVARALRRNIEINGFRQVVVIEAAVTDFIGTAAIQPPASRTNLGQAYVTAVAGDSSLNVEAVTIDSMAGEIGGAALMSIDVEGHEVSVLRGAREFIRQYQPILVVEAVAAQLSRADSSLVELLGELALLEYSAFQINRISVTRPDEHAFDEHYHLNWLCIPRPRESEFGKVNRAFAKRAFSPSRIRR